MNIVSVIRNERTEDSVIAVRTENFSVSYEQLFSDLDSVRNQLSGLGVQANEKVALLAEDSYCYIVFSLAILELDAVVIPVPVNSSKPEIETILEKIKINHFLFTPPYYPVAGAVLLDTPGPGEDSWFFLKFSVENTERILPAPLRAAFIRFSSGTTGNRKGVVLSHRAIIERTAAADKALKISPDDKILWVLDMSFHFVVTILLFLRRRATIVLCGSPLPEKMSKALSENRISVIYATPYHYGLLTRFDLFAPAMLKDVRLAVSTAMKLHPEPARNFMEKFGFGLTQAYGIIEVGLAFVNTSGRPEKCDSVGAVLPDYQLKLRSPDATGRGEILLRGPGMFDAYFDPFVLREDLFKDGWFATGDIGKLDEDGYLHIVGRSKNVINFIGMKIFPYEAEEVILSHPAVSEAKVEGKRHDNFGEIPVAFVVPEKKYSGRDEELKKELRKFCMRRLAAYCVPKEFIIIPELEKTGSGKIRRTNE
ncbi:MAG: class I adenylate-forming enzyme family protein [Victivallaceae bacterium]|nr:class I adenylate-forming enzyme family protein [Victivallaceae bacterium]